MPSDARAACFLTAPLGQSGGPCRWPEDGLLGTTVSFLKRNKFPTAGLSLGAGHMGNFYFNFILYAFLY